MSFHICGNGDIDVELLRRVVEYEGYNEQLPKEITFFWEVLREMTTTERKLFLQFVWARNRLPLKESDFPIFIILIILLIQLVIHHKIGIYDLDF